jgi:hypothetical protein
MSYGQLAGIQIQSCHMHKLKRHVGIFLTAPLMQSYPFLTGSIVMPASRELHFVALCEHLHQNLFWACISRIQAQVPLATSGKLTESFHQQISCGIDVSVMARVAFRARRGADLECRVPEPPVSAKPAIPQTALSTVWIGANPIASRYPPHALF